MTSEQASDIQTVIFDMDGVLIDSPQQWQLLTADFFSGYVDDWNQEKMLSVTGLNIEDMYQQLVAMRVRLSREQFLAFVTRRREKFICSGFRCFMVSNHC